MIFLFLLITTSFGFFKVPGCEENPDGEFSESDFDFVPDLSTLSFTIGLVIMIGTILSVIPQYVKLIRTRDSSGLSPFYLLIQFINQVTTVANACITNATYIHSCVYIGFSQCFPVLVSWTQIMLLAMVYLPQIFFYLLFYPNKKEFILFKLPLICLPIVIIISIICLGTVPLLEFTDGECGDITGGFAFVYGIIAAVCVIIQWSPQIYMTFRRKAAGALSMLMLSITAPGMTVLTLYMIFITKQPFSTWLSNAASAVQQLILLSMLVYYELLLPRFKHKDQEKAPLVENEQQTINDYKNNQNPNDLIE
ncbi:PQ loop repeatcontaining protein [Entamoeba histolytica KU27]|uniref:PQ loop repeatcontaining protein n=2 Tax=Entamoeba histolytica TaxID=5759 RepID=M2S3X1_ENTHI|nr:PQ loop repeatcontaining protein [Entamoeba histolytica KU27]ENY65598.1 hypothetical protein EHI7A_081070 [Entamoeba histolytica HM-1:IMSS-A]